MPVLLPVLFMLIALQLARSFAPQLDLKGRREIFLAAALFFGLTVAAGTGLLSLCQAIRFSGIFLFWIVLCLAGTGLAFARRNKRPLPGGPAPAGFTPEERFLLAGWSILAGVLFWLASSTAPNSWDAMVYHLSRVEHWIHRRNVAYFPTPITRELWAMPWAEYLMLHLKVLSASDRWANCVQWAGWAGSGLGVSLIARQLGATRTGQIASAVFAATIPMAILQSTSTKNDLPTAFWLVCAVWAFLKWLQEGQKPAHVLLASSAVALALFTKGSAYLFLPPFLVITLILAPRDGKKIRLFLTALLLGVILLTGFFHIRNRLDFGRWNPAKEDVQLENAAMNVPLFISNLVRHSAVHLQTPSQRLNDLFIHLVRGSYDKLGVDFYDARITHYLKEELFLQKSTVYNEYYAGNCLAFLLGTVCCVLGLIRRREDRGLLRLYILALLSAYAFFVLYMRWQPWISRLHLPLFILGAPVIAVVLEETGQHRRRAVVLALACLLAGLPWVVHNKMRPLVGTQNAFNIPRREQYFLDRPYMAGPCRKVTATVEASGCRRVGLKLKDDQWEYPYWALLNRASRPVDIRHINVDNPSQRYEENSWRPCAIISEDAAAGKSPLVFRGKTYLWRGSWKPLNVYLESGRD